MSREFDLPVERGLFTKLISSQSQVRTDAELRERDSPSTGGGAPPPAMDQGERGWWQMNK